MSDVVVAIGLLFCTANSFFFSGVETGIYTLNRVRLRLRAERGERAAVRLQGFIRRPQLLICAILIGNHLANFGASFLCRNLVSRTFRPADPELWTMLLLTPFLFVFGELSPKNVFLLRAESLVYRTSGILGVANGAFRPLALLLRSLGRLTGALPRRLPPEDAVLSRRRLRDLVGEVEEEGLLTSEQRRMVGNVMRIASLSVRDAMVPLKEVDAIVTGFCREELVAVSARRGKTRIPVLDRERGEPVGVISVLDLVYRPTVALPDLVHQVPRFPSTYSVDQCVRILRRARRQLAFVTEAGEGVVGIVTMKDLVEEVSGELPAF